MVEAILEILLSSLGEVALQIVGEVLIEFGWGSAKETFRERTRAKPLFAAPGAILLGALLGAISRFAWPMRVFAPGPVRGLSLLVSPLVTGLAMNQYGEWRDRHHKPRSYISTFWGGALFAFGMAFVRFVWAPR